MLSGFATTKAQDNNNTEEYYIKWIKQYPEINTTKKTKINSKSISNLLFGKKTLNLIKPVSVFAQSTDTFIVLDQGNGLIFTIENNNLKSPAFIKKTIKRFPSLVDISKIDNQTYLITDSYKNNIYIIKLKDKKIKKLNDSLNLKRPAGILFDKTTKEIWVVETAAHRISVLNIKGELIKTIGTRGNKPGEFNFPVSICSDSKGYKYILDAMNFRVQIFDQNGKFHSSFGETGDATGYFARPKAIACDSKDHIYITDALFHNVQIFNKNGELLYYFGGQGKEKEKFWIPASIHIDKNDYIYIADSYNSRIQVFQLLKKD